MKRILNLRIICLAATILFLMACYLAARKVMVLDVELGMSRAEVHKVLGEPTDDHSDWFPEEWDRVAFSEKIYERITGISYDAEGKVDMVFVINTIFGHRFIRTITH